LSSTGIRVSDDILGRLMGAIGKKLDGEMTFQEFALLMTSDVMDSLNEMDNLDDYTAAAASSGSGPSGPPSSSEPTGSEAASGDGSETEGGGAEGKPVRF
jgi:hypothetical protein